MPQYKLVVTNHIGDHVQVALQGRLSLADYDSLRTTLREGWLTVKPKSATIDMSEVEYLDSAAALVLVQFEQLARKQGAEIQYTGWRPGMEAIKNMINAEELATPPLAPAHRQQNYIAGIGESVMNMGTDILNVIGFLGALFLSFSHIARHPSHVRWGDMFSYMQRVGVEGMPIVCLIGMLLGGIMAFMSAMQLAAFGATIYVASLVAVAMLKELGPIMTAILVAGRSGSAFAAEIGTMQVNEEVDALSVMGYDPVIFLVFPKMLAAILVTPILTTFGNLMAILGGLLVGVLGLDISMGAYIDQTLRSLTTHDIVVGAIKAAVFAFLISGIGCQRGFMVRGGSSAVGLATTSAVVSAMFLIIVADSIFAIVLHYIS